MWILFVFGFLIGVAVCCGVGLIDERIERKKAERNVENCDLEDWCCEHCKAYEEYFSTWEDPDDAWKRLDNDHCSNGCPLVDAQIILDDKRIKKWKKKVKKQ